MELLKEASALSPQLIAWRRALHQIPEVGLHLPQTADYVCNELEKMGLTPRRFTSCSGVTALINGTGEGPVVALRADMDALPVTEETNLPFAAKNNCMHACGHDGHTAVLLAAARMLLAHREEFTGAVKLIFQPGEENFGGAGYMIREGVLEEPKVGAFFSQHAGCLADAPAGSFSFRSGTLMASFDSFDLEIRGTGCHGARPEEGVDPIFAAAQTVSALQALVSRECAATDPVVLSFGAIHGGDTYNVIPDTVRLKGALRTCAPATRTRMKRRMEELAGGVAAALGARAALAFAEGYPPTVNDPACTALAADAARSLFGPDAAVAMAQPIMVSEDASHYLERVPGAYWLFTNPANADCRHHNAKFDIDEDILWKAAALFVQTALDWLAHQ